MGVMVNDGTGTNLCSPSQTVEEGLNWKLEADDGPELRAQDEVMVSIRTESPFWDAPGTYRDARIPSSKPASLRVYIQVGFISVHVKYYFQQIY